MNPISNTDKIALHQAIHEDVESGSTLYMDDHKGYSKIGGLLYQRGTVKHSAKEYVDELAFRLNEGSQKREAMDRVNSLLDKTVGKGLKYAELVQ